jgi:DNA repair photolyase
MIISASRRTDIPAFYAEWFINRLREGFLLVQNPFNAHKYSKVDLSPDKVDAIVFWTKNPEPLLKYLDDIDDMGYKYYFQFTLTGYPREIEQSLPELHKLLSTFKNLSDKIGPEKVIWRYDPIIISDITDEEFAVQNFNRLADELYKYAKRVVISFADFYKKITKNFDKLTKNSDIHFYDINLKPEQIYDISYQISAIANERSMQIVSCAEKIDLSNCGIEHGKCIDDDLIEELFGISLSVGKDKHQRDECGCIQSKDIGQYNSCTHDCIYCYANNNKALARRNLAAHDPSSPTLIGSASVDASTEKKKKQLNLLK